MAKRNYENEELENNEVEEEPMSEWRDRFDGEARDYFDELERTGGDLVHPGKGCIASVELDSIYGWAVFKRRHNKKVFIDMIQDISDGCQTAKLLAYCVLDDAAYLLVKGNRKEAAVAFVEFIIREFTTKYNRGLRSVGNPFRKDYIFRVVPSQSLGAELNHIHSLSPDGIASQYPFCSYKYLLSGEHDANLILKLELDPSREDFESVISGMDGVSVSVPKGAENYKQVKKIINKDYAHQRYFKEKDVGFMISETAARTQTPYSKVAKKLGVEKRYDLMVSSVCDFINRRGCTYSEAIYALGLEDSQNLRIEVIAEINRVHHYSYDYIVTHIVNDPSDADNPYGDKDGTLLVELFRALGSAYGYTFEQLCVRFHITENLIYLRQMCGM